MKVRFTTMGQDSIDVELADTATLESLKSTLNLNPNLTIMLRGEKLTDGAPLQAGASYIGVNNVKGGKI